MRVAFFVFREDHRARSLRVGIVTFCHSRATLFARLNYTRMLKRGHQNHGGMIGPLEDPRADILPGKKWQHLCRRGTSLNKVALLFLFKFAYFLIYCILITVPEQKHHLLLAIYAWFRCKYLACPWHQTGIG